jgi:hypothetical protein
MPGDKKLKAILFRWTEKMDRDVKIYAFYMVSSSECGYILTEGYFADSVKALGIGSLRVSFYL